MRLRNIYFNEFNLLMGSGGIVYLPFVSGILSAYIKTSSIITKNFKVMPFLFVPDTVDNILENYTETPHIACFSISMWNEQLSLAIAKKIKEMYRECTIIFGGAQCPHEPTQYMIDNPYIDICVRAEGEDALLQIVEKISQNDKSFDRVPNIAFRDTSNRIIVNIEKPDYDRSLDAFPSPYLSGEFEYLLNKENHGYQAIVETNRGCPFLCTFCYWGKGGNNTKYRFRSLDTVFKDLEYLSEKRVEYIFNADSNFGMHQRDYEIALKLIELKKKNGYPDKFRTCWGKNTSERIFKIASLLQLNGLDKGVTLARQSNSDLVLKNIKRDNIKLEAYEFLEKNFNRLQVPVYAELILGLPGETALSWEVGIDQMLSAGLNNQLFIYQAEVYPNTELGSMEYQNKFQIQTTKIKLNEIHCSPREVTWIPEYQHIVTSTYSMTTADWRVMTNYSLVTMLMHSMKAGIYIIAYMHKRLELPYSMIFNLIISSEKKYLKSLMDYFKDYSKKLLKGEGRGLLLEEYSDVYLEAEEVAFLKITQNKESFYTDIYEELISLVPSKYLNEFREVIKFQSLLMPELKAEADLLAVEFETNIPEFCYSIFINKDITIRSEPTILRVYRNGYASMHEFTKKQLIWARKSGTILFNTDLNEQIKESIKISYDIDNFDDEKTFKISLFEPNRVKFEKFDSIKQIPVVKE